MLERLAKFAIVLVVGVLVAALAWWIMKEKPREMPPILYALSEDVIEKFNDGIPRVREVNELLLIVVQRGNRDEEKQFKSMLKERVHRAGKYKIEDWDDLKKTFGDNILQNLAQKMGWLPGQDPRNLEEAKKAIKVLATTGKQIDGVLLVTVTDFDEGELGYRAKVGVEGEIYSSEANKTLATLANTSESVDSRFNYLYIHHNLKQSSFPVRAFIWLIVAVGQPWALINLVRAVVRKRKNELNIILLVAFTLVDILLAWILLCSISVSGWTAIVLVVVAGALGYLNYDACDYIQRRLL